ARHATRRMPKHRSTAPTEAAAPTAARADRADTRRVVVSAQFLEGRPRPAATAPRAAAAETRQRIRRHRRTRTLGPPTRTPTARFRTGAARAAIARPPARPWPART